RPPSARRIPPVRSPRTARREIVPMTVRGFGLAVFLALGAAWVTAPAASRADESHLPTKIDFNRDILPILSENCYACHGPDKNKRKADLRLDTKDGLFTQHDDTRLVVPGKPDDSELYLRITTDDDNQRMPDPKSGKSLTNRQLALVKAWIE